MIEEVKTAFKNNLPSLSWMDDETRAAAVDKVGAAADDCSFIIKFFLTIWLKNL